MLTPIQLETLILEALSGSLDPQQQESLREELSKSQEARDLYCFHSRMHTLLEQRSKGLQALSQSPSSSSMGQVYTTQKRRSLRIASFSAAAIILITCIALSLIFVEPSAPRLSFAVAPGTQFTLTHTDSEQSAEEFVLTKNSRLQLSQGTVELTFASGVTSIVSAPADLTLKDSGKILLSEGIAWFHVPKGEEGFTVETEDLRIVDLGTEFGVKATPKDHDEIHVFSGEVEVTTLRVQKESVILTAGNSRRIDPMGRLLSIPNEPSKFSSKLPETLPYVHWSFDQIENGVFKAQGNHYQMDLANASPPRVAIDTLVAEGRYGSAVHFTGIKGQQLHTQLPGVEGDHPRTTACWVRTTYEPQPDEGGTDIAGLIGWGYCVDDNKLNHTNTIWKQFIDYSGVNALAAGTYHKGHTNIADGQWHHLACVLQPAKHPDGAMLVTLYVDGEVEQQFSTDPFSPPNTLINRSQSTPVRIGCSIHKPATPPIVFRGEIDEVYLFYGALDAASILNLMQENQPPH